MAKNFNVDPYYDDFDNTKNFHRILFKPGFAVQARDCLLYTSPSPRDRTRSRMPSSA